MNVVLLLLAGTGFVVDVQGWQIIDELCANNNLSVGVLPVDWCTSTATRCLWSNITCDDSSTQLLGVELWNTPLNMPLMRNINAPGPLVETMRFVNCGLTGSVPASLSTVTTLRVLDLSDNPALTNTGFNWAMLIKMREFSIANCQFSGASYFNSVPAFANLSVLNLANNSLVEQWQSATSATFPAMVAFNIENNKFYGQAPALVNTLEYKIDGNFFAELETYAGTYRTPPPPPTDTLSLLTVSNLFPFLPSPAPTPMPTPAPTPVLPLSMCDMSRVPFRKSPPAWVETLPNACGYVYNPDNHIYMESDFTTTFPDSTFANANRITTITTTTSSKQELTLTPTTKFDAVVVHINSCVRLSLVYCGGMVFYFVSLLLHFQ